MKNLQLTLHKTKATSTCSIFLGQRSIPIYMPLQEHQGGVLSAHQDLHRNEETNYNISLSRRGEEEERKEGPVQD